MKNLALLTTLIFIVSTSIAQTELWGVCSKGGEYDAGTIVKTDGNGNNFEVIHQFLTYTGKESSELLVASNGLYYGVSRLGGYFDEGVLFSYNPINGDYHVLHHFKDDGGGYHPIGTLVENNGKLYGATQSGGGYGKQGVLYEYTIATDTLVTKVSFDNQTGTYPYSGLMKSQNGKIYGTMSYGGPNTNSTGTLFEYNIANNAFTVKAVFDSLIGYKHKHPLLELSNGVFYGISTRGGTTGKGTLFQYNLANGNLLVLYDFSASSVHYPSGKIAVTSSGELYGTGTGGSNNAGALYAYSLLYNTFTIKHNFGNINDGKYPSNGVCIDTTGYLYGVTREGYQQTIAGSVYRFKPSTNQYTVLSNLASIPNGTNPLRIQRISNNTLIGTSNTVGTQGYSTIFKYNLSSNSIQKVFRFGEAPNGKYPKGELVYHGNGIFYGTCEYGGEHNGGTLFKFDTVGKIFTRIFSFDTIVGENPSGGLTLAPNGKYYGTSRWVGIYEFDPISENVVKKVHLSAYGISYALSSLLHADNNKLYGCTKYGGTSGNGSLYEYDYTTDSFRVVQLFDYQKHGMQPTNSPMQAYDGKIYGCTRNGAAFGDGAVYRYDYQTDVMDSVRSIHDYYTGSRPYGRLFQANDSKLWGMAYDGGSTMHQGSIFSVDLFTDTIELEHSFTPYTGANVGKSKGGLIQSSNGKFYGFTYTHYQMTHFGSNGIIEFDPVTDSITKKVNLGYRVGYDAEGSLIEIGGCPHVFHYVKDTACVSYATPSGNHIFTTNGYHHEIISNATACGGDSVIDYMIHLYPVFESRDTMEVCYNGNIYMHDSTLLVNMTTNQSHTNTLIAKTNGCDSLVHTYVKVYVMDTSVVNLGHMLYSNYASQRYQWLDPANGYSPRFGDTLQYLYPTQNGQYAVAINANGCIDTSLVHWVTSIEIIDLLEKTNINVFPNPTQDFVNIESTYLEELTLKIQVFSEEGKLLNELIMEKEPKCKIDLSTYPNGIYFILLSTGEKSKSIQIIRY
jgi:uncharacterized repeat protein (TIGR03803 family)